MPQQLPIPAGYAYQAVSNFFLNDSGDVAGNVYAPDTRGSLQPSIAIWRNLQPMVLSHPTLPCGAADASSVWGMNRAGRLVGTSSQAATASSNGCSMIWTYDGASFRAVPAPPNSPGCAPGQYQSFIKDLLGINDADDLLVQVDNYLCASGIRGAAVISANGAYRFLAPPAGVTYPIAIALNNRGQFAGYYGGGGLNTLLFWDNPASVQVVGQGGYAALNNIGQMNYTTGFYGQYGYRIYSNGTSAPIQLPAGVSPVGLYLNDAGQILGGGLVNGNPRAFLLTPGGACASDMTSAVSIARGGFRYNRTTGRYTQTVTITNTGGATITGPISLALDGVPASATLYGISRATLCATPQGSPLLTSPVTSLAPGGQAAFTVEFINTAGSGITYNTRVIAGPGGR